MKTKIRLKSDVVEHKGKKSLVISYQFLQLNLDFEDKLLFAKFVHADVFRYDHNQVQRSYHESEDDEASQELFGVALLNQFDNNPHAWKFSSSYPLIAGVNTEIAGGMIVASMANGVEEQILLKLDLGQFISFVDQEKVDTNTNISFLSFSNDLQSLKLCTLSFKEIHKKRVILNHKNWKSETKILNEEKSFCKLYETRDKIQRIRLYK